MDTSDDVRGSSHAGAAPAVTPVAPSAAIPAPPVSASVASTAPTALSRSVSQQSAASTRSHRSMRGHGRGSSRRGSSHVPLPGTSSSSVTSEDSKSLTSFPSFSPKANSSPSPTRASSRTRAVGHTASSASLIQSLLSQQQQQQQQQTSSLLPPASTTASASSVTALSTARSALFEDTALLSSSKYIPGALHLADDAHIARLVGENGAVALVRQLAEDLAKRDAQMEAVRQRADDRERLLRKIILECGLTSLDLETRLRTLEQEQEARRTAQREAAAAAAASSPETTANSLATASRRRVSDLVSDALADDNSIHSSDYHYNNATIRASSGKSVDAGASSGADGTTKGWKDFLWGGGTTKKNSSPGVPTAATPRTVKRIPLGNGSGDRRLPVTEELFQPPLPIDPEPDYDYDTKRKPSGGSARGIAQSTVAPTEPPSGELGTGAAAGAQSASGSGRKGSLATQALRLFVGGSTGSNGSGSPESVPSPGTSGPGSGTVRARSEARNSIASSTASLRTASSTNGRKPSTPISAAVARASRPSTIQQGNGSRASILSMRRTASMALLNGGTAPMTIPAGGGAGSSASNPRSQAQERWGEMMDSSPAGDAFVRRQYVPVEMDTILPLDVQPPTLTHMYNRYNSSGHLIDRFGFIYDQRRKKRQREAAQMARHVKHGSSGRRSRMLSISHNRQTSRASPELFGRPDDGENEEDAGVDRDNGNAADGPDRKSIGSGSNGASTINSRPASIAENDDDLASAAASIDDAKEGPPKRWQDYLKIATFPTELLAHTPAMSDAQIEVITDSVGPKSPGLLTPDRRGFAPPLFGTSTAATTSATATTVAGTTSGLDSDSLAYGTTEANGDDVSASQQTQYDQQSQGEPGHATQDAHLKKRSSSTALLVKEDVEPVRLLLQQLGDLHDTLQKERTVRWNEFLRKVRAERKREGDAIAAAAAAAAAAATTATAATAEPRFLRATAVMPETRIADGEIVGVAGLGNKGKLGRAKWNEFRALILGGIPLVLRAKVWAECTGAASLRVPGAYDDLVAAVARSAQARAEANKAETEASMNQASAETEADVAAQVEADIYRTLTDNIFFREGPGTAKLKEVLLAYARRNPEVGYCQGMNLIAANLLLVTPSAEDAFWLLASIVETILPAGYYDHSLAASRADQQVLRRYVAEVLPRLSAHFDALAIDLETMTFQWFLSVFTDCLSAEALFRVWDVVFCLGDGSVFLFQVALALLKLNEAALLRCTTPAAVYTYINHQMTNHAISIDGLIQASEALRKLVRREDVEARRAAALDADRTLAAARAAAVAEAKASRKHKAEKKAAAMAADVAS